MSFIKSIRKKIIGAFSERGIIIQKKTPLNSEQKLVEYLLKKYSVDLVIDVGANKGQFAHEILKTGYSHSVISFEPLPETYDELKRNSHKYPNWITEKSAIGSTQGEISINISANTESSSVLPMLSSHFELAPESKYVSTVTVPIISLDRYMVERKIPAENIFLKIDVQGYEESVLEGALELLKHVKILQLEISFIPLYDGSLVYYEMMNKLEKMNFSFYSFLPAFSDYKTGQVFQVDAIYLRK